MILLTIEKKIMIANGSESSNLSASVNKNENAVTGGRIRR